MFGFEWNEKEEREALIEIGEERGEARGEARGLERGRLEGKIEAIKDLMSNLKWSPEKAMTALGIAPSEFSRYPYYALNPTQDIQLSSPRCNIQSCGYEKRYILRIYLVYTFSKITP